MTSMRAVVVAGLAAAAATGLATPAMAAPAKPTAPAAKTAKPVKAPVTTDQCAAANGRVQRARDGVGTCVGGKDDGHLIKDVSTRRADGSTTAPTRYGSAYDDDDFPGFRSGDDRRDDDRRYSDDQGYRDRGYGDQGYGDRDGSRYDRADDRSTDRPYNSDY